MAKKESTVVYDKHVEICAEFLTDEQFGKLMFTLTMGKEPDFGDDQLLALAYAFIALQKNIDDEKYEKICETNRKNGRLGGAPKGNKNAAKWKQPQNNLKTTSKQPSFYQENDEENENAETLDTKGRRGRKQPKQPNAKKNNPNEKDKEKDKEKENDAGLFSDNPADSSADSSFSLFGEYENVELTQDERQALQDKFERSGALINEVSEWISGAKNNVPDHYHFCLRWAKKANWPKRKEIPPSEPIVLTDPLNEEEQERMVAQMRERVNGMFTGS